MWRRFFYEMQQKGEAGEYEVLFQALETDGLEVLGVQVRVNLPNPKGTRDGTRVIDILARATRKHPWGLAKGQYLAIEVKTGMATRNASELAGDHRMYYDPTTTFTGEIARMLGLKGKPTGQLPTIEVRIPDDKLSY